jgi:predicted 3-demethylubiquinone-9 3-methyltransferase (glyoxalase superfamily)
MEQKITPSLWFNGNAEAAVKFYVSIFPKSQTLSTQFYPGTEDKGLAEFQKDMAGKALVIEFELNGQRFLAINAGPEFTFNESISFAITCEDQDEIDYYWDRLSSVSESEQCGWCKDRFGLSWQVVPKNMGDLLRRPNAYAHLMQMKKLVIAAF